MSDDELRALVEALPDAGGVLRTPRGYAVKARPDAGRAALLGTSWRRSTPGSSRRAASCAPPAPLPQAARAPVRRVAPPPAAPQRVYVLPAGALTG